MSSTTLKIVVFTHQGCMGGDRAIAYFHERQIPVQVKDIMNDPRARTEFQKEGYFATPMIVIDGKPFMGFDEEKIETLLQ